MIDSIHLRVHNLSRYKAFLNYLLANSKQDMSQSSITLPENKNARTIWVGMAEYHHRGKSLIFTKGGKLTSSHYSLAWNLPLGGDLGYVDFNFSIPKLLYGTNVIQFVQHKNECKKGLMNYTYDNYLANEERTYKRLRHFIKVFFDKYFWNGSQTISPYDIEIRRFDISWNQIFNSKKDALDYLNYQKNIKKKHLRYTSKNRQTYTSSIFYHTRDYGCKIYHKGSEYESSDGEKKKHIKANERIKNPDYKGRKVLFNVQQIQNFADRILRYEITFRNAYMSKIFWNSVFRRNNEAWKARMRKFKEFRKISDAAFGLTSSGKKSPFMYKVYMGNVFKTNLEDKKNIERYQYRFKCVDLSVGLSKRDRNFFIWWNKQKQKRVGFFIKVDEETTRKVVGEAKLVDLGDGIERDLPREVRFSPYLLKRCFKIFDDFRDHFEVKQRTYLTNSAQRIEEYNESVKNFNESLGSSIQEPKKQTIRVGNIKPILALLQQYSLEDLVENKMIARNTAWRYRKKFKQLEINYRPGSVFNIASCKGFAVYHSTIALGGFYKYLINDVFW